MNWIYPASSLDAVKRQLSSLIGIYGFPNVVPEFIDHRWTMIKWRFNFSRFEASLSHVKEIMLRL